MPITHADLDALDQALAVIGRYEPDGHKVQWRSFFRDDLAAAVDAIVRAAPSLLAEVWRLREHVASIARARDNATKSMPTNQSIVDELTAAFFAAYGDYSDRCFCGPAAGEFVERAMRHAAGVAEEKLAAARLDAANARAVAGEVIDALADPGVPSRSIADLRSRLAAPSDFAARAREAVKRLRESIGNQDTPEDVAALDADLASLLALLGVRS